MGNKKLTIIIVGAGLGGLSAGLALARHGHNVRILERRATLSRKGAGILCRSGATRIMKTWGVQEDMERISDTLTRTVFRDMTTGEITMHSIAVDVSEHPDWGTTRPWLQEIIYKHAVTAGVRIEFGVEVVDVSEDEGHAKVKLKDGTEVECDLLIAADGIRSRIRSILLAEFGDRIEPKTTKTTMYSFMLTREQIESSADARKLLEGDQLDVNAMQIHFGRNKWVLSRFGEVAYDWRGTFSVDGETDQRGFWDEEGDIEYVRKQFQEAQPGIRGALEVASRTDRWRLAEMPDLPRWTSKPDGGRIILLGDSAHAMVPSAAQGYSQIVEDIGVLVYLLTERPDVSISQNAKQWETLRKPRTERIKASAAFNQSFYTGQKPRSNRQGAVRSKSLKDTVPDMNAHFATAAFLKWTLDFDAIEEARQAISRPAAKL